LLAEPEDGNVLNSGYLTFHFFITQGGSGAFTIQNLVINGVK
jgi:hypothetical protein